jgi:adenosylmethionine-8-amino-7-oxononanoate aminotransferase
MSEYLADEPLIVDRAEGCYLVDTEGRRYLDGVSSLWVVTHGHRHPALDRAVRRQLGRVAHSTLLGLANVPAVELAERLVALAPSGLRRVFYACDGASAVEAALKMAFQYWRNLGEAGRTRFVKLQGGYHGDTIGAVSVGGIDLFHSPYRALCFATYEAPAPYCYRCPLGLRYPSCALACAEALEDVLARHHREVAAVILEPLVLAAAGMITARPGYLRRVWEACRRWGVLLIADEVATGFGRTGRMFACEHEGVSPDLLVVGKGITGGYLPLSAVLASERVFEAFLGPYEERKILFHGHTYAGNPLACAVAIANLELFERERTLERLPPKVERLAQGLAELASLPHVGDVRQRGLMAGIELVADRGSKEPFPLGARVGWRVSRRARDMGVFLRSVGDVVVIMPSTSRLPGANRPAGRGLPPLHRRCDGGAVMASLGPLAWVEEELARLRSADLYRQLLQLSGGPRPIATVAGRRCIVLASNDYLGLRAHPAVRKAAAEAAQRLGTGAGASRLLAGNLELHRELEWRLARLKGAEDAIVFPAGYMANLGTIAALVGPDDAVYSDELNHASIIDGCRLSRARIHIYRHGDVEHLEHLLKASRPRRRLIVSDTVFSMDGDLAPLPALVELAERYGCMLMVDEAHATGVLGPGGAGVVEHFQLQGRVPIIMGTLSKALASQGGFVAGPGPLIDYLRNRARTFVYSTGLAPPAAAAALAALDVMEREPWRRRRLLSLVERLKSGLDHLGYTVFPSQSAIVPVLVGQAAAALKLAAALLAQGVLCPAIRPPTVPEGTSRLRASLTAGHKPKDLETVLAAFAHARRAIQPNP